MAKNTWKFYIFRKKRPYPRGYVHVSCMYARNSKMLGFQHHDSQFQKSKSTLMLNSELNTLLLSLYRTTSWNLHHKGTSESWTSVGINWKKVKSKHTGMEAVQQIQTLRGRIHHTYIGLHWLMQKFTLIFLSYEFCFSPPPQDANDSGQWTIFWIGHWWTKLKEQIFFSDDKWCHSHGGRNHLEDPLRMTSESPLSKLSGL